MNVITVESEAFQQIIQMIEKLKNLILESRPTTELEWMTGDEVLIFLNISSRSLQNYRDSGKLGYTKMGRKKILYRRKDVLELLKNNYCKPFKKQN